MVKVGSAAPGFAAADDTGAEFTLGALRGRKAILHFYPKSNTPGCTQEACDFRNLSPALPEKNSIQTASSSESSRT